MKLFSLYTFSALLILIALLSCQKDVSVSSPNPLEYITSLTYTLTPAEGGDPVVWSFSDPDGEGGANPVIHIDFLTPYTIYDAVIELYNESVVPTEVISIEVEKESNDHQFFYTFSEVLGSYQYIDYDENGYPVGLRTRVIALGPSEGLLNIKLIHKPEKAVPGVSDGLSLDAKGEIDFDITFLMRIKN